MTFDVLFGQSPGVLKLPVAIQLPESSIEVCVRRIQEQIKLPISIPINDAQFAATTAASSAFIETQRLATRVSKDSLRWQQNETAISPYPFEEDEDAFNVEYRKVQ